MDATLFRRSAIDARRDAGAGEPIEPDPLSATALAGAALAILLAAGALVAQFEVARRVTVRGYLAPESGVMRIRAPTGGAVTEALVHEGEPVAAGQPLLRLESRRATGSDPDVAVAMARDFAALRAELVAQRDLAVASRAADLAEIDRRQAALADERRVLEAQAEAASDRVALAERRERELGPVVAAGHLPRGQLQQQQDRVAELRLDRLRAEQQALERAAQAGALAAERESISSRAAGRLAELDAAIARLAIEERAAVVQHDAVLRAPAAGRVLRLAGRVGMVLPPGQVAVTLAPSDAPLRAVLLVPSREAGMVERGQPVVLRLDAFPYQRFGVQRATVSRVGGSVVLPGESELPLAIAEPTFEVHAELASRTLVGSGRSWWLRNDLTFEADIILERATLLDRLLDPLRSVTRRGG